MGIIHENVGFSTIILSNQDMVSLSPDQLIWSFKMVYHLVKSNKYFLRYCQLSELQPSSCCVYSLSGIIKPIFYQKLGSCSVTNAGEIDTNNMKSSRSQCKIANVKYLLSAHIGGRVGYYRLALGIIKSLLGSCWFRKTLGTNMLVSAHVGGLEPSLDLYQCIGRSKPMHDPNSSGFSLQWIIVRYPF